MELHFNLNLATGYRSSSQISRVLTEDWMNRMLMNFKRSIQIIIMCKTRLDNNYNSFAIKDLSDSHHEGTTRR